MRRNSLLAFAVILVVGSAPLLTACTSPAAPTATATATADPRAEAVALLKGALDAGSPNATDVQRSASLDLAIESLTAVCDDPNSAVTGEAYDLLTGAQSVLQNNGIVVCDVF